MSIGKDRKIRRRDLKTGDMRVIQALPLSPRGFRGSHNHRYFFTTDLDDKIMTGVDLETGRTLPLKGQKLEAEPVTLDDDKFLVVLEREKDQITYMRAFDVSDGREYGAVD